MYRLRSAAFVFLCAGTLIAFARPPQSSSKPASPPGQSRDSRLIAGPREPLNQALAAGATATITLQPVAPKTVPASSYPPGSSIVGSTLTLGSVPSRVWIEAQVTGWAPDILKVIQVTISGTDPEEDGGGFSGSAAMCGGNPATGAGDITPARQACNVSADCRPTMSGIASPCAFGEPCRCSQFSAGGYFPPGKWCEPAFQDLCDAQSFNSGIAFFCAVDIATVNFRFGFGAEPGEVPTDFAPTYIGTLVLDVPANAKGTYTIDLNEQQTFMQNPNNPPNNVIPIAAFNAAVIKVIGCHANAECQDNDACTADICSEGCCTHAPIAGWDQATECCNPTNGAQSAKPASTSCRVGGCSLGGSSGTPTSTPRLDGTPCSDDPCYAQGQCAAGQCVASQHAGSDCPKTRFISFDIDPGSTPRAYRVRLISLHHPEPPYGSGVTADFSAFEGEVRWVGAPTSYVESTVESTPVHAAVTGCNAHFQNWSSIDLLHVTGAEIIPSSIYDVQSIEQGLDINEESNYSDPIEIITARWGEVGIPYSPPSLTEQPDVGDQSMLVDKFRNKPGSVSKPRALLVGLDAAGIPDLSSDVSFAEISAAVDAFRGRAYPFSGPAPCP